MRVIISFFIFALIFNCDTKFGRKAGHYSNLLGFLFASTAGAKFVSADFISTSTLAPVVIAKTRKLGFTMDSEMSKDCQITFNGTAVNASVSLSEDKKTIYFTPDSIGWPVNLETVNYINSGVCRDAKGISLAAEGTGVPAFVADTVTYLSASGNDANAGTTESPLLTFLKAVQTAYSACPGACAVAAKGGNYSVSSSIPVPPNVSIFGGFDPSDWRARRADKTMLAPYDTIIEDSSASVTGIAGVPYGTLRFDSYTGAKEKSIVDGIIIKGPASGTAGSYGGPLSFSSISAGAGFSIRNTITLDRMSSASFSSAGFIGANNAGKISLYNSSFSGSDSIAASTSRFGICYNGSSFGSDLTVSLSSIIGGTASVNSAGFYPAGTINGKITLYQNTIQGGSNTGGDSIGVGIAFAGTDGFIVSENTVSNGTGTNGYAIYHSAGTGAVIYKNKITAGNGTANSAGIELAGTAAGAAVSENEITSAGSSGGLFGIRNSTATTHTWSNNKITFGLWPGTSVTGIRVNANSVASGNTITLAGCSAGICASTVGIDSNASFPTFESNTISSGDCPNAGCVSRGIFTSGGGGIVTISGNTITTGTALTESIGIKYTINQGLTVSGNTVTAGSCTGAACNTAGFYISGSTSGIAMTGNTFSVFPCIGSSCIQAGAYVLSSGAAGTVINGNTMKGGDSVNATAAVRAMILNTGGTLKRNTFTVGSGNGTLRTLDLGSTANAVKLCSNVLVGGTSTVAATPTTLNIGSLSNATVQFYGNTIIGGQSAGTVDPVAFASGGVFSYDFKYNLISGASGFAGNTTCMNELVSVTYTALDTNNVSLCNSLYIEQPGNVNLTQICAGNFAQAACGTPLASPPGASNTNLAPVFINPASNDFHLGGATPPGISTAMGAPAVASINGTCGDSFDRDGNLRTAGSAIGAYK